MEEKKIFKKQKLLRFCLIAAGLIILARLILPYVVLRYANKTLARMPGYYGQVRDIDIALLRGAYKIDSIYLIKVDTSTGKQTPFFHARSVDLSVEWKALFHGSLVGELVFQNPGLRFTKDKVEPSQVGRDSSHFDKLLDDFMPLQINRFEVNDGYIQYKDDHCSPKVDIALTNLYVLARNLRNSYDSAVLLPASVTASATVYGGTLDFGMKLNPLAPRPTFDMNAELKNTSLVKLNEFFQAYAKVDVNKGTFGMYTEVAAKQGNFTGYVKPLIQDLDVLGKEDRKDNILRKLWEGLVGTIGEIFQNQPKDQLATKIPFQGKTNDPQTDVWTTILNVLRNAFIRALQPAIDHEISIATVTAPQAEKKKTFLQKIFGKKDRKDKV